MSTKSWENARRVIGLVRQNGTSNRKQLPRITVSRGGALYYSRFGNKIDKKQKRQRPTGENGLGEGDRPCDPVWSLSDLQTFS